ncbi:MAG TPA: NUDIX hydrolase, partial [Hyphomonas sp.]|nr:NUDIX hydrolase [Hyphomonas sp.]
TIIFPTRMNLVKLARAASVESAVAIFGAEPVVSVLPKPGKTEDGAPCLFIPEEAGYGQTVELLSNVKV